MDDLKVKVTGNSDSYDRVLGKVIEMNTQLATEVGKAKDILESMNPVYERLAENAEKYANAANKVVKVRTSRSSSNLGSSSDSTSTGRSSTSNSSDDSLSKTEEARRKIEDSHANITKMINMHNSKNLKSIYDNLSNLSSVIRGKGSFSTIVRHGLNGYSDFNSMNESQSNINKVLDRQRNKNNKSSSSSTPNINAKGDASDITSKLEGVGKASKGAESGLGAVEGAAGGAEAGLAGAGAAAGGAEAGLVGLGAVAGPVGLVIAGVAIIAIGLLAVMYKLGESGYKTQMNIANSQNVLGSSFNNAYSYARKLNDEMGIALDRTMGMVSATAQLARAAGFSTASAGIMGTATTKWSANISSKTGDKPEDINSAIGNAISSGSSAGIQKYGLNVDDNTAKMWLLKKHGIDAFNGSVSDATMQYARFSVIQQEVGLMGYNTAASTDSVTARYIRLGNTMDSIGKNVKTIFIPVFEALVTMLDSVAHATLDVMNWFRKLSGVEPLKWVEAGPSQDQVDKTQKFTAGLKQTGDELDKLKNQLYGFDEVISQSPFDPSIPELALGANGTVDEIGKANNKADISDTGLGETGSKTAKPDYAPKFVRTSVELMKTGDETAWGFLTALGKDTLLHMPIIAELAALAKGDTGGFVKALLQDGLLLFGPIGWTISALWRGFDIFSDFRDKNGSWDVLLHFLGLDVLWDTVKSLFGFGPTFAGPTQSVTQSVFSSQQPYANTVPYVKVTGSAPKTDKSAPATPSQTVTGSQSSYTNNVPHVNMTGVNLPKHKDGGFHVKEHLAIMHPDEVTVPLGGSASEPAFKSIAKSIDSNRDNVSNQPSLTINVNMGEKGINVYNTHEFNQFTAKLADKIQQILRSTGSYTAGLRG